MASMLTYLVPGSVLWLCVLALMVTAAGQLLMQILSRRKEDELLKTIPGPAQHWLFGNAWEVADQEKGLEQLSRWAQTYGSPYRLGVGPFRNAVILSDPDTLRTILSTNEPKEPQISHILEPWIGDGLLLSKGKKWTRNRRLLTPGFHFEILKPYVEIFSASTHIMMDIWRDALKLKPCLEMFDHVSLMVFDSLLKCAFGSENTIQNTGKDNPYLKAVYAISDLIMKRVRNPMVHKAALYKLTPNGRKFRETCDVIHQYSKDVIRRRKRSREHNNHQTKEQEQEDEKKKHLDFLDILLEAKDADGTGLTDEEIQNEVDTFMFEGHDTTSSALSWFLYNMARNPEHQRKCVEEINDVMNDRNDVTWDDMSKLEYLTTCIKESIRIHTTVPTVARQITRQMVFPNGHSAPEGTWILANIYGLHHDPKIWPDPEKYDPSRFTSANSRGRSPHAFVPFSAGPRNCIGQNFAMYELKTCGALLLKNFEFSVHDKPVPCFKLVLRAKNGIWLNVKERSRS